MKRGRYYFGLFSAAGIFVLLSLFHFRMDRPAAVSAGSSVGDADDPNARVRHEWIMLRDPVTMQIPKDIKKKELEFARSLPVKEQFNALNKTGNQSAVNWISRGPWNVGGRTRALGVDVSNLNVINAGGVSGGMWRSADGGGTWTMSSAASSLASVTCLAQDTRAGQTATWYYGTGEYRGNSASSGSNGSYTGDGIFKSTNNGASWTLLPATSTGVPQTFDNFFDYVWNVAVSPANGNVFAATYGAIFRSTNGGTNWSVVLGGASPYSAFTDVQIDAAGNIYATGDAGGGMSGVWKSSTGASGSWTNISPADLPSSTRRIVIGIAPSNDNTLYFVAETPSFGLNNHSFWKYNATTNTWTNRSVNLPAFGAPVGNFDSQGSYDLVIKVKPDNENVVFIGGSNLYRSTDGFATTGNTAWVGGYSTANNISLYPNHHPDNHSLAFIPGSPAILISGHDGGISKTTNDLASPVVWSFLTSGYLTTQFYTIAIDHGTNGSNTIIGGLQDNGTWKTTSPSGTATWTSIYGGDGAFSAIANGEGSDYASSQNGTTYRFFGAQFARVDPTGGAGYLFINPFVLDPNNSNIMYFAGGNYAWRNSDLTAIPAGSNSTTSVNWARLNNSMVAGSTSVSALAVSKTNPTNRLYIGHSAGSVVRVDGANTGDPTGTTVTPAGVAANSYVSSIAIDPTDGSKVLLTYSNYSIISIYYSTDAGVSWTNVEGNLSGATGPSCRAAAIVPGTVGVNNYYVGTSTGLYSTILLNGASTVWSQEGAGTIGNVVVSYLDSRPSDGAIVAGTHGRGVYSGNVLTGVNENPNVITEFKLHQNYPNPFNPSTTVEFEIPSASKVRIAVFDVLGRSVRLLKEGTYDQGKYSTSFNGEGLASGVYICRLEAQSLTGSGKIIQERKMVLAK